MLPMNRGVEDKKIEFDLGYTIRIFHDGGMTCTFRACLEKSPNDENASMFEKIHAILHLARNVDYVSPERGIGLIEREGSPSHLTDAYLVGDGEPSSDEDEDSSLCERLTGRYSLHDLFRRLIKSPPEWAKLKGKAIWDDRGALDTDDPKQDFQAPFVITIAQVDEPSFIRFRQQPTLDDTREVASIMCKLTLDNRSIKSDFLNLSEDYITNVINFNPNRNGLLNYCLDRRLFFSFSKRGAIAIASNLNALPACFVVPSFINLLEILRARWIACCILNMEVDDLIDRLDGHHIKKVSDPKTIDSLVELRQLYTRFLRDPMPYLFDGGSVTEIAQRAVVELDMDRLSRAIHGKMQIVDAMRQDIEDRERQKRREQFDQDWSRIQALPENADAQS